MNVCLGMSYQKMERCDKSWLRRTPGADPKTTLRTIIYNRRTAVKVYREQRNCQSDVVWWVRVKAGDLQPGVHLHGRDTSSAQADGQGLTRRGFNRMLVLWQNR
jgi:hypothetical protein